jgi:hypothetical protein
MQAVEGGSFRLAEGAMAPFAPEASLFVAMDHDVPLVLAPVGPAGLVVAELLVRVHAALLLLTSLISKGASEPALCSTYPSSTLAWGATPGFEVPRIPYF